MANTNQKTTTKTRAKTSKVVSADVNTVVDNEVQVEDEVKTIATEAKPVVKKWVNDEGIRCRSVTSGPLYMSGIKSHILYIWSDEGDVTEVEYQDLVAAIRSNSAYVMKPYFVVEDVEFAQAYPQVKKIYDALYSIQDLRDVLNLPPAVMKSTILALPEGARETIKTLAAQMVTNGQLDSIKKISILDEIYDTKLLMMTELFNA